MNNTTWLLLATGLPAAAIAWAVTSAYYRSRRRRDAHAAAAALTHAKNEATAAHDATRNKLQEAERHLHILYSETEHFIKMRLSRKMDATGRGWEGIVVPDLLHPELSGTALAHAHQHILESLEEATVHIRQRVKDATLVAVKNMLEEPQAALVRAQHAINAELQRHQNAHPSVIKSLMGLDLRITLIFDEVQRLRIAAKSWPGLQRGDAPMADIVEAARSRVEDYPRVIYSYDSETGNTWVEGSRVEPATVALSELMKNAVAASTRKAHVFVQDTSYGYALCVEDRGLGMNEYDRQRANDAMSSPIPVDVTDTEAAQHNGFNIIGNLASTYGIRAEVTGNPFGGTRGVVLVPNRYIVPAPADPRNTGYDPERYANPDMSRPSARAARTQAAQGTPSSPVTTTANGLPKRQRSTTAPEATPPVMHNAQYLDLEKTMSGMTNLADALSALHEPEGEQQ